MLANHYDEVIVVSPKPYYPRLLSRLGVGPEYYQSMNDFRDYEYDNVCVRFPRFLTAPTSYHRWRNWQYVEQAIERSIRGDFDDIVAYFCDPAGLATQRFCQKRGAEYSVIIQENSGWFDDLIGQERIQDMVSEASSVLRVNPNDINRLQRYNENTQYVPNGFDPETFYHMGKKQARKKLGLPPDETILVNVASLKVHHKNQLNLVESFARIQDTHPSKLYLIGKGPDKQTIRSSVQQHGLDSRVFFTGRVPHDEVNLWMNAADLFVLPSYHEGNPTVMFECMATGTPQVCTDVGGIGDELTGGFVVPDPDDTDELSDAIREALSKDWDGTAIKEAGSKYTWSSIANAIYSVYHDHEPSPFTSETKKS
jgi:glycosyltransferase involved in cell wall biosynthesis